MWKLHCIAVVVSSFRKKQFKRGTSLPGLHPGDELRHAHRLLPGHRGEQAAGAGALQGAHPHLQQAAAPGAGPGTRARPRTRVRVACLRDEQRGARGQRSRSQHSGPTFGTWWDVNIYFISVNVFRYLIRCNCIYLYILWTFSSWRSFGCNRLYTFQWNKNQNLFICT